MPEYQIRFDDAYLIQAFRKYRKQHGARYVSIAIKSIATILLLALAAFSAWQLNWWPTLLFATLVLLMFTGHLIDFWLIKRRFRKSPYRNDDMVISVTTDGFHEVGSNSENRFTWAVFTRARSFRDGVLLFQGPSFFNWLPNAALTNGTRAEVEYLVRENVNDYKIVEHAHFIPDCDKGE